MPPEAASLANALGLIGKNIECMLNTTLIYPGKHEGSIFMQMLCGRLKHVIARVEVIDKETIAAHMVGDYLHDKQFKHAFTMYLRNMWQQKDEQIESLLHGTDTVSASDADAAAAAEASVASSNAEVARTAPANAAIASAAPLSAKTNATAAAMVAPAAKSAETTGTEPAEMVVTQTAATATTNESNAGTEQSALLAADAESTQPTLRAACDVKTA